MKNKKIDSTIAYFLNNNFKYLKNRIKEEYIKVYFSYIIFFLAISAVFLFLLPIIVGFFFIILFFSYMLTSSDKNSQLHHEAQSVILNKDYNDKVIEIDSELSIKYKIPQGLYHERELNKFNIYTDSKVEKSEIIKIKENKEEQINIVSLTDTTVEEEKILDKKIKILELELELKKLNNN